MKITPGTPEIVFDIPFVAVVPIPPPVPLFVHEVVPAVYSDASKCTMGDGADVVWPICSLAVKVAVTARRPTHAARRM